MVFLNLTLDDTSFPGNETNGTLFNAGPAMTSSPVSKALKIIPLTLVMLASITGNIAVIHAVYADIRMRTATNILILSQSAADLGTSLLVIPVALVSVAFDGWIFGDKFCTTNGFLNMYFTQVTVLQLMIIAFDRYLVIVKTSDYSFKTNNAAKTVVLAWGACFVGSFPWLPLLSRRVQMAYLPGFYTCAPQYSNPIGGLELFILIVTLLCFAFLPLVGIFYCYYHIRGVIRRNHYSVSPLSLSNAQKMATFVYAKSASTSKVVIATTLVQVFPACFLVVLDGLQVVYIPHSLETAVKWIMWCHCMVKPIIYATKNRTWTKVLREYFGKWSFGSAKIGINSRLLPTKCRHNRNRRIENCEKPFTPAGTLQTWFQAWLADDEVDNFFKI